MEPKAKIESVMAELGLTVEAEFVPFSQSRNKAEKHRSLNWRVTLKRNGRDVITTDYSAGAAHCPSYNAKVPHNWNRPARMWQGMVCEWECENGFKAAFSGLGSFGEFSAARERRKIGDEFRNARVPIMPEAADVVWSLVLDADVLNYRGFSDWAGNFGYDDDSIKAKSLYDACMEIALQLRGAIGEAGMEKLAEAGQDY